jgi:hypothetical protein
MRQKRAEACGDGATLCQRRHKSDVVTLYLDTPAHPALAPSLRIAHAARLEQITETNW